jgi:plastocyanin
MREASWLAILCTLGVTTALAACGDEEESISPRTTQTGATTGTMTTTSSGGEGGSGQGGSGQGGSGQGGSGQGGSGQGGSGQGGGGGSINGCADADFQPPMNPGNVVVTFQNFAYTPQCLLISPGTNVTFSGVGTDPFMMHPLMPGTVENDVATPAASSPIQPTGSGAPQSVTFALPDAGDFGYYCDLHFDGGMFGAIRVQ